LRRIGRDENQGYGGMIGNSLHVLKVDNSKGDLLWIFKRIAVLEKKIIGQLNSAKKDLLDKFPLEKYIGYLENIPPLVRLYLHK